MPLHDLQCQDCNKVTPNIYVPMDEVMGFAQTCECGGSMDFDLRSKRSRNTRAIKFREFTLDHTVRVAGQKTEIRSLADIRRLEREHQDIDLCVEAFSYDGIRGNENPVATPEPVVMSEEQKQAFAERFRDMNIKDERSARDYE